MVPLKPKFHKLIQNTYLKFAKIMRRRNIIYTLIRGGENRVLIDIKYLHK